MDAISAIYLILFLIGAAVDLANTGMAIVASGSHR